MKKIIRKFYFKIFKHYRILERKFCTYSEADRLIKDSYKLPESHRWVLDTDNEDGNRAFGHVYLCRKERITE